MATLTSPELEAVRRALSTAIAVNYTKAQINAALQAIEDAMTTASIPQAAVGATLAAYVSARIDAATLPLTLTAAQKKTLFAYWAKVKFERDR